MRKIIHIDMDCFYAAIEMRDNPELTTVPLAVGGSEKERGVLCTSNYFARKFGVRSAMSTAYAKKLCPDLIVLKPDIEKYKVVAESIRKIFLEYTDIIEPLSLDEAYLDVSHSPKYNGIATLIAKEIRERIFNSERLTASAGIAPNKFLAKIASDWHKPDGQFVIPPDRVGQFILQLPVSKIHGVGKITAQKLESKGIFTCKELQSIAFNDLVEQFGRFGEHLHELCRGIDERPVENCRERKSLSVECTFVQDISDQEGCMQSIHALYEELLARLAKHQELIIHKQFIKIKFSNFQQTTVEASSTEPILELYENLCKKGLTRQDRPVRLLGLGVGFKPDLSKKSTQLELMSP
ncbi:MAG: DNA polymerase IV [Gammaproteobacteria bacterium RIFCSPHIGHO2_12_FULL_35_23]|nr:MAG: DNA polymerase IV [Gammaproteobacteria bacterium RIFCSPHIGHO2_12_FULL_35_23]